MPRYAGMLILLTRGSREPLGSLGGIRLRRMTVSDSLRYDLIP